MVGQARNGKSGHLGRVGCVVLKMAKNAVQFKFVRTHTKTIAFGCLLSVPVGRPVEEIRKLYVYLALLIDYSFARAFHKVSSR
jgi:hypothetical protein